MKLYKLTISFETVVAAEDATTAAEVARRQIREIVSDTNTESTNVNHVARVIEADELPHGWNDQCYAYGKDVRQIKEILGET